MFKKTDATIQGHAIDKIICWFCFGYEKEKGKTRIQDHIKKSSMPSIFYSLIWLIIFKLSIQMVTNIVYSY